MTCRIRFLACHRRRPFQLCRLAVYLLLVGALLASGALVQAAPVTFRFQAKVVAVDVLFPAQLPFSIQNGDTINGRFTFEPFDANSSTSATNTVQTLGASFDLGSIVLQTSNYFLRARNDSPMIDAPEILTDHLFLGCGPFDSTTCNPGTVPTVETIHWNFILPLSGPGSLLDGADIPGDPNVWNQFTPGYISLTFQEVGVADVLWITAQVNGFTVVPEPTSLELTSSFLGLFAVSRWFLRRCHNSADVFEQ